MCAPGLAWAAVSTTMTTMTTLPVSPPPLVLPTRELPWQTVMWGSAQVRISWMAWDEFWIEKLAAVAGAVATAAVVMVVLSVSRTMSVRDAALEWVMAR